MIMPINLFPKQKQLPHKTHQENSLYIKTHVPHFLQSVVQPDFLSHTYFGDKHIMISIFEIY